ADVPSALGARALSRLRGVPEPIGRRAPQAAQEKADRLIVRIDGRPGRQHGILAPEWPCRRFVKYEDRRSDEQCVKERIRDSIEEGAARLKRRHLDYIGEAAQIIEDHYVHGALDDMK